MPHEKPRWPWTEDDMVRLRHIVTAARTANEYVSSHSRDSLREDHIPTLGLMKAIEVIGEAAASIDREIRDAMPNVPWPQIVGMRHRLVHAYFEVDFDIVWKTATKAAPQLAAEVEAFLSKWDTTDLDDS